MSIIEKLMRIQIKIKVPKNLYNSFGKYNYRNAESICEAVKPYLMQEGVALTLSDEIVEVGGRIYVKATATLCDVGKQEEYSVAAFARESAEKKGMDDSQITGTASSYARKYALNGMFLLDDTKDADTDEYNNEKVKRSGETQKKMENRKQSGNEFHSSEPVCCISEDEFLTITELVREKDVNEEKLLEQYQISSFKQLTRTQYTILKQRLEKAVN